MNPKLFTGSRELVLGKPFLGRGGGLADSLFLLLSEEVQFLLDMNVY